MPNAKFSETKSLIRLFLGTLLFLTFLTGVNIMIILNSIGAPLFEPITRSVAAVPEQETPVTKALEAPVVAVNCKNWTKPKEFRTQAETARFIFKGCDSLNNLVNTTNANSGDLFELSSKEKTSDYLPLQEGLNVIQVSAAGQTKLIHFHRDLQ